mgnify:CR=1 FL=1|tara:strand:+ start:3938 stop:4627 length:690 start_codon:yes stop_codon:yes gene_type:complete
MKNLLKTCIKMKLYTTGCSHTHGAGSALGRQYRSRNWAAKLAKKLDAEWIDTSRPGNNNMMIRSRVIENVYGHNIKPDHAVIQFTYPSRYWTPGRYHQPNYKESKLKACTIHMINEIKQLEIVLKSASVPYTFIIWPSLFPECYGKVEASFDHSRILNYDGKHFGMDGLLQTHGFKYPLPTGGGLPDGHFEEDAQEFLADAVYNHIVAGKKLTPKGEMPTSELFVDQLY